MTLSPDDIEALEFERKFVVPRGRVDAAIACLDAYCRPDRRYAANEVHSIYFDTPGLRLLQEKSDSDLYKTKVRLRWYEDVEAGPAGSPAFLEVKRRVGTRRQKWRQAVDLDAGWLSRARLNDKRLCDVLDGLTLDPAVAIAGLRPILVVRYLRRRWDDPLTGARICLDRRISTPRVNLHLLARASPTALDANVLEVKNRSGIAPPNLHFLAAIQAQLTSFSKYSSCFHAATRLAGAA